MIDIYLLLMFTNYKTDPAYRCVNDEHVNLLKSKGIAANQLYKYTLESYMKEFKITPKLAEIIATKISELHKLGFYHGDLHEKNIVLDVIGDDEFEVRLIDFETLRTMEELQDDPDEVKILYDF